MSVDPELIELIDELCELRRDAKAMTRSGNPAIRAEAQQALKQISIDLRHLTRLADAEL